MSEINFDPNPLFYDMLKFYVENKDKDELMVICNEGSSRCFSGSESVNTSKGYKQIKDVKVNDIVKSYNVDSKKIENKRVVNTFKNKNDKRCIKVKFKNGKTITATEDHLFFYEGNWIQLKHLLSQKQLQKIANKQDTTWYNV